MAILTSATNKSIIAVILSVSIPIALNIKNPSAVIAGLIGGATAATVANRSFRSGKTKEKFSLPINKEVSLLVDEKKNIDEQGIVESQKSPLLETQSHNNSVIALLEKKGIEVIKHRQTQEGDELLDSIACYMAKYYSFLEKLHNNIKASIANKVGFYYSLYGKSQQEIQSCTLLCNKLYRAKILHHYYYDKRRKIIRGLVHLHSDIIQFLNGGWFERAILGIVKEKFTECKNVEFLVNPHIRFTNGDRFELDILFLVDNQLFWIECKTGKHCNYKDCLSKYCRHREKLGVVKDNAFLVSLGLSEEDANKWTKLWTITVVNPDELLRKI